MAIQKRDAYNAGFNAGFGGHPVSANPFSSADVDNFNDWDMGYAAYQEEYNGWDGLPPDEDYDFDMDAMDGDFDSAMSSAGFGTDEDYGDYGDNGQWDE